MNIPRISVPLLAFLLPAFALPLALGVASLRALHLPAAASATATADPAQAPQPQERIYLPLIAPIMVSLPGEMTRLEIEVGVAIHADGGYALMSRLKDQPEAVQSGLAETVLRTVEALGAGAGTDDLHAALPDSLRTAMNDRLEELGEDRAVLEVLITGWAWAE